MTTQQTYKYPMALTQQFKHCGNPFRIDTYKGCGFGCSYCFVYNRGGKFNTEFKIADIDAIKKVFKTAFESNKDSKNLTIELLRRKVPLHLGGMSDPFQPNEFEYKATYEFLKLTNEYRYPVLISTKNAHLSTEYYDVLDPSIHAFQISLISINEDYVRRFEQKTPSPQKRIEFIRDLKKRGFWVGVRIQPLIEIDEAVGVVNELSGKIDYITVEHMKIGNDSANKINLFKTAKLDPDDFVSIGREYEFKTEIKKRNIEILKSISHCPIGCGDNDLHEFSDSNNCCGVDTINENFNNWIKYNTMYINKTGDKSQWYPKCNCSSCFNSECRTNGWTFKDYVDDYLVATPKIGKCNVNLM